ncbi:hypothetical protein [Streptomyces scabiei]|uniref:hypothetical protein n=1 Tax=Streptomyces scabiei TaxID=1930 RepID=UPI00298F930D|nr:hypothetical protein [Streptomyces scabiei]
MGAGARVDSWATAAHGNLRQRTTGEATDTGGLAPGTLEAFFGRLLTRAGPWTGMWGSPSAATGRLQAVNGHHRPTRGSFAQCGVPVPHPERVVDAVLDHARDARHFGTGRTEMWPAIVRLPADRLGRSGLPGHRPRGVHRPESAPGA